MQARKLQQEIVDRVGVRPNLRQLAVIWDHTGKTTLKSDTDLMVLDNQLDELAARAKSMLDPSPNPPPGENETVVADAEPIEEAPATAAAPVAAAPESPSAIETATRLRTPFDDQWLSWLNQVADLAAAIRNGSHPLAAFTATNEGFRMRDPFEGMLDSLYRNEGSRYVYFSRAAKQLAEQRGKPLPHYSDLLLATVTSGLRALWLAPQHCKTCKADIADKVGHSLARRVLDGKVRLPDSSRSEGRNLKYCYDTRCMVCDMALKELLARDVKNQDLSPRERGLAEIQDVVDVIGYLSSELNKRGITTMHIKACVKAVLREQQPSNRRPRRKS